jgi:hypothetical protein
MKIGWVGSVGIVAPQEKLLSEGHTLFVWWTDGKRGAEDISGLSEKYPGQLYVMNGDLDGLVEESDFVVSEYAFPRTLIKRLLRLCKRHGVPIVGANSDAYIRLETDRIYAKQVSVGALGLQSYSVKRFLTHEDLQAALSLNRKQRVVLKPFKENAVYYESAYIMNPEDAIYLSNSIRNKVYPSGGMVVEDFLEGYEV